MKKTSGLVWGIVLISAGVLAALSALDIVNINLFFSGWWTLIIIIPCAVGLVTKREKTDNLIGLGVGILLLLCCQGVVDFSLLLKLFVPAIILLIGIKILINAVKGNNAAEIISDMKTDGRQPTIGCATFSGTNLNFDGQPFEGAELTAAFGGIKCDLRNAVIEKDCAIRVSATFGGIDILVPNNVNVKTNANAVFGGVSNKTVYRDQNAVTIYVSGMCLFGGVDIK